MGARPRAACAAARIRRMESCSVLLPRSGLVNARTRTSADPYVRRALPPPSTAEGLSGSGRDRRCGGDGDSVAVFLHVAGESPPIPLSREKYRRMYVHIRATHSNSVP